MELTFEEFAKKYQISLRYVKILAQRGHYELLEYNGKQYRVVECGKSGNNKPLRKIVVDDMPSRTCRHLSSEEKRVAYERLLQLEASGESDAIRRVAEEFGVSYWSIYRLYKSGYRERKRRRDNGQTRKFLPAEVLDTFDSIYIQNASGSNVRLALNLTMRKYPMYRYSYRYFLHRAQQLEPLRIRFHQEAQYEQQHLPHIRRDLWEEFDFMEQVSLDGWTVPDRVLQQWGLESLLNQKFKFNGKDTSFVVVAAIDTKTGYPLAWNAFERSVNQYDVLKILLDVVYRWGRPESWLFDNGSEFVNESVQRFVRGLYTSDEHEAKRRVLFSEPYHPYSKGRHERIHRIWKDEFCAFSRSYSPNQQESRKPGKKLSYVKPTQTLEEWKNQFSAYLAGYFQDAQRVMWMNAQYSRTHEINQSRPTTLRKALEIAYLNYSPVRVDQWKLAYLYGLKFRTKLSHGVLKASLTLNPLQMIYIPDGEIPHNELVEVVVNPTNMYQAWVCDLNGVQLSEAWDVRGKNTVAPNTRETASMLRKIRNKMNKRAKEAAELKAQFTSIQHILSGKDELQIPTHSEEELYTNIQQQDQHCVLSDDGIDDEYMNIALTMYNQLEEKYDGSDSES